MVNANASPFELGQLKLFARLTPLNGYVCGHVIDGARDIILLSPGDESKAINPFWPSSSTPARALSQTRVSGRFIK